MRRWRFNAAPNRKLTTTLRWSVASISRSVDTPSLPLYLDGAGGEHRAGLMQPWICGLLPYSRENFKGKHFACLPLRTDMVRCDVIQQIAPYTAKTFSRRVLISHV